MEENGARKALMSGSGPTVFGIFESRAEAEAAAEKLADKKIVKQIFVTTFQRKEIADAG